MVAHAVDDKPPGLACCGDNLPAGAHAEGVAAAVGEIVVPGELIARCAKPRMPGVLAVLDAVDEALRMLDAETDGEGLGLHGQPLHLQRAEKIAAAVADGEKHDIRVEIASVRAHAAHRALLREQFLHRHTEAHLAAPRYNLLAHRDDDALQKIGANVGLGLIGDLLRRAVAGEDRVHLMPQRIFAAAGELAVGKRPCAAFAKLDIARKVQRAVLPEAVHLRRALRYSLPLLQEERPIAVFCQRVGAEEPRRPSADNDRPPGKRRLPRRKGNLRLRRTPEDVFVVQRAHLFFAQRRLHLHLIDKPRRFAAAGVEGFFDNFIGKGVLRQFEPVCDLSAQRVQRLVQRQMQLIDNDHRHPLL